MAYDTTLRITFKRAGFTNEQITAILLKPDLIASYYRLGEKMSAWLEANATLVRESDIDVILADGLAIFEQTHRHEQLSLEDAEPLIEDDEEDYEEDLPSEPVSPDPDPEDEADETDDDDEDEDEDEDEDSWFRDVYKAVVE